MSTQAVELRERKLKKNQLATASRTMELIMEVPSGSKVS